MRNLLIFGLCVLFLTVNIRQSGIENLFFQPILSDYGKINPVNYAVFVDVGFVVSLTHPFNKYTVGSLYRPFTE